MLYNKYTVLATRFFFLFFLILNLDIRLYTLFKVTTRLFFIQITLLFVAIIVNIFFGLNGIIVYYFWSVWVCSNLIILLLRLPLNKRCLFTFMVNILFILIIGGLVA